MNTSTLLRPGVILSALLIVLPVLLAAFFPNSTKDLGRRIPERLLVFASSLLCIPYWLISVQFGVFRWEWLLVYALVPVGIAGLLLQARHADAQQRGNWRDYLVLLALGLAVDLRWLERAWPAGLAALGKMLLVDAGVLGFLVIRQLDGVGFDLRLKRDDVKFGMREFCLYAVLAIPLGLGMHFLLVHAILPSPVRLVGAFVFTFLFIAIPEELFFRGWIQNLVERRLGRTPALIATAILFGLAHWNKRTALFNWRYVLMAAIAGIFYGRAWRAQRRVGASALTHASVDTVWSIWLR